MYVCQVIISFISEWTKNFFLYFDPALTYATNVKNTDLLYDNILTVDSLIIFASLYANINKFNDYLTTAFINTAII